MRDWDRLGEWLGRFADPFARAVLRRKEEQKNGHLDAQLRWMRHTVMGANLTQPEEIEPEAENVLTSFVPRA